MCRMSMMLIGGSYAGPLAAGSAAGGLSSVAAGGFSSGATGAAQSCGQFWVFSGPSQTPSPQGLLAGAFGLGLGGGAPGAAVAGPQAESIQAAASNIDSNLKGIPFFILCLL
jgi:hypothetical protein